MRISLFLRSTAFAWAAIIVGSLLGGCSGTTSGGSTSAAPVITAQPDNQTVSVGQVAAFTVAATGTPPLSYQWQKDGTTIGGATSSSYTIPATTAADNGAQFRVVVSNSAGSVASSAATLTVNSGPPPQLQISTTSLPNGQLQTAYSATLQATGGTTPYSWSISSGSLPTGLTLAATTGVISSTPTAAGTFPFTVKVSDNAGNSASAPLTIVVTATAAAAPFGHVVIVVEENTNYANVVGSSQAPYLNGLMTQYGSATQYYANTHPSIGNYMMLTTGQVLTNDDSQTPQSFPVSANNVVRELVAAGKTWKSYAEDLPSVGYTGGDTGNYAVRHNPLAYIADVQNTASQQQNLVPFTQFPLDLAAGSLPDFSFIVPNLCDDAHDCSLNAADTWLKTNIDPLIKNSAFQKDGLLIVVFDESGNDNTHGGGRVVAALVSPAFSKAGYSSTTLYQHQSVLRLILEGLGVKTLPASASNAPVMWEFFTFVPPT